jgi:type I restriction enzyme S subunit
MNEGPRPYPEYKDSGLPWLGQVPVHWDVRASKRMFTESGERTWPDDQQLSATQAYGVILQAEYERLVNRKVVRILNHLDKRIHVEKDDFVISMRSFQGGLERAWCRGAIRSSYVVLKPREGIYVPYFAHLFKSHPYIQALRTTSEFIRDGQDLTFSNFCDVHLPVIPVDEQKAIADYLDANAVMIRRFIRNRRRLIEVLNEQKHAIINRAVIRGLDPNVPLKPSGIDWFDNIPEHWTTIRLRNIAELRVSNVDKHSKDGELPVRLCNYTDVYKNSVITADMPFIAATASRDEIVEFHIRVGDVIITKDSEDWQDIGIPAIVIQTADDLVCGYHLAILRPRASLITGGFLAYAMQCRSVVTQLHSAAKGVTRYGLSQGAIKSLGLALPSLEEQEKIVLHIDEATGSLNDMVKRAQHEIDLVREYRTRLIADVVTGKVDVRHLVSDTLARPPSVALRKPADSGRTANVYFRRAVFAAEIVHRLHKEPTFGHTKCQKLIFISEKRCGVETGSTYHRHAAGPYDPQALRSIDSQMEKQQWYAAHKDDKRYWYIPLSNAGDHKTYFDWYFANIEEEFTKIIELFRKATTEQCEIVATLYKAWDDLLNSGEQVTEDRIVDEVLHHWNESKQRIDEGRWRIAIGWMEKKGIVPKLIASTKAEDLECLEADEYVDELPEECGDEVAEEVTDADD